MALPDAAIVTDYLLEQTTSLIDGLVVDTARMRANLDATRGLIYSSAALLELVKSGMSREDAYALVQQAAARTWAGGPPFKQSLSEAASGLELNLDGVFRPERDVTGLGEVFARLERLDPDRC